jgi:hypothetical protein
MQIGEIRKLIKYVSIKYGNETNYQKKVFVEQQITTTVSVIKENLGYFALVADNEITIESASLKQSYENLKKYLQE